MGNETFIQSDKSKSGSLARWAPVALIVLVVAFYVYGSRPVGPVAGWLDDPKAAFEKASASGSNVVLAFYQEGCPPCAAMDRRVLPSSQVQEALVGYVPVRVDTWDDTKLTQKYEVWETPTYVIADAKGNVLARTSGYLEVGEFVSFLNRGRLAGGP